ncbi:MAG: 30S ribosomal protein S3, partial [Nitrosopumilaceae archaeon]
VQITISGKLRGDRSAFEKHSVGILPRAGHHAEVIVAEDIAHVKTPMGLIGIRIRIAIKEKLIPEFEFKDKSKKAKQKQKEEIVVKVTADKPVSTIKVETEEERTARTESEQIELEAKKIATLETLEEEEEKFKA